MNLPTKVKPISRTSLIKAAIIISIFTIFFNITEGTISILFGAENESISLIFFGINSFVEVTSSCLVIWRFSTEKSLKEKSAIKLIKLEKKATLGIGSLFILLASGTFVNAIIALVKHRAPNSSVVGLVITSISLLIMSFIWLIKSYAAKLLNSFTMASDAKCSLSCIQITLVVFFSSLIYTVWRNVWWVDSVAALILSMLFAKEGIGMILWAISQDFNGGCCCKSDLIKKGSIGNISCEDLKECKIAVLTKEVIKKGSIGNISCEDLKECKITVLTKEVINEGNGNSQNDVKEISKENSTNDNANKSDK
ncbi:860_t:CDS:1 [Cetraspora pellucida]|uniref:860_t:CDS:1 n=1 Tax=Cetraspora pellucida TaxID=1433469 RepID=A0A9N8VUG1_9GLOM|nr:860_t:CDS:1 [Cetraspora pellucida]